MALSGANLVGNVYSDRVLLLENDLHMRQIYGEQLEFSGYEVYYADNLEQASNILDYVPVNLLVCNEYFEEEKKNLVPYLQHLRKEGLQSSVIILTENEERVFDQLPEDEVGIETFPIPCDLDHFFKHDINQFVSIAAMVLDKMAGILVINDSHAESIEIENLLIQNYYRICSVQDGMHGKEILQKALQTRHPIDLIILDLINQNYPGCLFLAELSSLSILLPVIVISTLEYSKERILTKTAYSVSSILSKKEISTNLIPTIAEILH